MIYLISIYFSGISSSGNDAFLFDTTRPKMERMYKPAFLIPVRSPISMIEWTHKGIRNKVANIEEDNRNMAYDTTIVGEELKPERHWLSSSLIGKENAKRKMSEDDEPRYSAVQQPRPISSAQRSYRSDSSAKEEYKLLR